MKQYAAPIFIYIFITVFISTFVYLSNPLYQGQYLSLLAASAAIVLVILLFCFCVGAAYDAIDTWGNK